MSKFQIPAKHGQAKVEYALILSLLAIALIIVLMILGPQISNLLGITTKAISTPATGSMTTNEIIADFQARIQAYYQKYGRWPRTWSPYNFTDIGLNPNDWNKPVNGLYFSPHGSEVGIANHKGDGIQVYVNDLNGNTLQVYDGWGIWCNSTACYYHTVAPGNEVDINTIKVTGN